MSDMDDSCMENISGGPGGGCDGPTYTVFTEVFDQHLNNNLHIMNYIWIIKTGYDGPTYMVFGQDIVERNQFYILHNRYSYLGEQILGLGSGTVWHGLPSLTAKNYLWNVV